MITIIQFLLHKCSRKMYYFSPFQQKWHFVLNFCIHVSRILFFSNLLEQKLFSVLRTPLDVASYEITEQLPFHA